MTATKNNLTASQVEQVLSAYKVYKNTGTAESGKWVFQPCDYDSSFELYSSGYRTKREAIAAAFADLPNLDAE